MKWYQWAANIIVCGGGVLLLLFICGVCFYVGCQATKLEEATARVVEAK